MTVVEPILFGLTLVAYLLGSVVFGANLFLKHRELGSVGVRISFGGLLCQTGSILIHTMRIVLSGAQQVATGKSSEVPFATPAEAWSFLAWTVVAIFLAVSVRPRLRSLGAFALPAALAAVSTAGAMSSRDIRPVLSEVPGWALALHVAASVLSLGAFSLAFLCAVSYLIQDRLLKEKRLGGLFGALPPLDVLDTTSYWLVVLGFCLLTFGVISGAILAQDAWKTSWLLHPKSYLSVVLWVVYGTYLYIRGIANWRGRLTHASVVAAVIVVALLYAGLSLV